MHCLPYHHILSERQFNSAVIHCIPEDYSPALPHEIQQIIWSSLEV